MLVILIVFRKNRINKIQIFFFDLVLRKISDKEIVIFVTNDSLGCRVYTKVGKGSGTGTERKIRVRYGVQSRLYLYFGYF